MRSARARLRALSAAVAVALCASGFATSAAADDGPTASPPPPRAAPVPRSYPRSFGTYDGLVEYATGVAKEQQVLSDRLASLAHRDDNTAAALAAVLAPQARGGLGGADADLVDNPRTARLRSRLATDAAARQQLVASGALVRANVPWRMPLDGEITQGFGPTSLFLEPPLAYGGTVYPHFHAGTDIGAPWGSPIYAAAAGTVVFAGTMGDGAEVVVIAHDAGLVSMYAHLDNLVHPPAVKAGDTVQAGDQIGNLGLTGITTGPHLHWAVWRDGELIDPLSLIGS
jgi:murein DD-endopeptidase MepM/ murein hydrolase activator NlpD